MPGKLLSSLGIEKQSSYVKRYFYNTNMKASIYMSVIVIILEIWMIIHMTRTVYEDHLQSIFWTIAEKYYSNYFVLLSSGVLMLLYALRSIYKEKSSFRLKLLAILPAVLCLVVTVFEIWRISIFKPAPDNGKDLHNYILLLTESIVLIAFTIVFITGKKDVRWQSLTVMYVFSFVCLNFGILLSANAYAKGEQVLAFLTMELFVVCLLIWRPWLGLAILTGTYFIFYLRINDMIAFNTGEKGITESTLINGFTMWISTAMFCIANYNKTMKQALKDENLEQVNEHLSRISVEDELTGIHNMIYFRSEADKLLHYVTTDKSTAIFLFFDIENFKSYNEKYGFHEGNELLKKAAHLINDAFSGSLVSRFSDDHFVVLTKDDGIRDTVSQLADKIHLLEGEVRLSLKCGAYKPEDDECDVSLACDRARFACNRIKKHYDRNYRLYDKSLEDKFHLKQYIVNNIDNAIAYGHIKVYYQPVVSTQSGNICGLEALARWNDPKYGLLPPGAFIEILEEHRQIHKLDRCIVELVCKDYCEAAEKGLAFAPVSLNFSRLDFELFDITEFLLEMTSKYKVPKSFLEVEVTESTLNDQQDLLQNAMRSLHSSGFNVWLDDFGSGYSSLNVLKDYQFDVLKIDMKFLSGFTTNSKTRPILNNIVALTKQLRMISLSEGVETQEQFDFLKKIGCNRAQGYLFSKPVPIEQLRERISKGELSIEKNSLS